MDIDDETQQRDASSIEHRDLRSALEFAVLIAGELAKRRPPVKTPAALKPFVGGKRIPNGGLGRIRRAIDSDPDFRRQLAAGALPELVDEVGRLWLARPTGWAADAQRLVEQARRSEADTDARSELAGEQKRRRAAEVAAARVRSEVIALERQSEDQRNEIESLRADLSKAVEEVAEIRAQLTDARNETRHARDRERSAVDRLERVSAERDAALTDSKNAATVRDEALAAGRRSDVTHEELLAFVSDARRLADRASALIGEDSERTSVERAPLALPGGLSSRSPEAAEFFVRSAAEIVIDGYNVSKLARPDDTLEEQREWLICCMENITRRFGTKVTIVFDGAEVIGSHARTRRLVRVKYSPPGVIADDVIRDFVRWHPVSEPVVVVTNDREIVRDVRYMGANVLPSQALIAVL